MVKVLVRDNNVEQALRVLKKKGQKEGLLREIKERRYFETGTAAKKRMKNEAVRRERKRISKEKGLFVLNALIIIYAKIVRKFIIKGKYMIESTY